MAKKKRGAARPSTSKTAEQQPPEPTGKTSLHRKKRQGVGPQEALASVSQPPKRVGQGPVGDKPAASKGLPLADVMAGKVGRKDIPPLTEEDRALVDRFKQQQEVRSQVFALLEKEAAGMLLELSMVLMRLRAAVMDRSGNSKKLLKLFETGIIDELLALDDPGDVDRVKFRNMLKMLLS